MSAVLTTLVSVAKDPQSITLVNINDSNVD